MAELVDYNLIQAFQSATAPRQQAMRSFAETLGGSLGDVGSALVGRQMDVKEKRRQLEAYKQALAQEQGQLQSEKQRLMDLLKTEQQPYKQVEVQTNLQNIDKRLGEIGSVSKTIPADIGGAVRFRTYRDVNPAMLPKRQDAAPDYRDVEMRERQDAAERKARQESQTLAEQRAYDEQKAAEDRAFQLQLAAMRKTEEKPEKPKELGTTDRESIASGRQAMLSLLDLKDFVVNNRDSFGPASGRFGAGSAAVTGKGPVATFNTKRGIAVKSFGKKLEGGKLAEGDQRVYESMIGDANLEADQILTNLDAIALTTYQRAKDDLSLLPDGPVKENALKDLEDQAVKLGIIDAAASSASEDAQPTTLPKASDIEAAGGVRVE